LSRSLWVFFNSHPLSTLLGIFHVKKTKNGHSNAHFQPLFAPNYERENGAYLVLTKSVDEC
jgi:hypothetical protein